MNSKERFFATIDRRPVDRPAVWMPWNYRHTLQSTAAPE